MFVCPRDMARLLISHCRHVSPPAFQTLSVLLRKVRPATETFRFPCVAFVIDKALHSGFFVLHRRWICQVRSVALHRILFDDNTGTYYTVLSS